MCANCMLVSYLHCQYDSPPARRNMFVICKVCRCSGSWQVYVVMGALVDRSQCRAKSVWSACRSLLYFYLLCFQIIIIIFINNYHKRSFKIALTISKLRFVCLRVSRGEWTCVFLSRWWVLFWSVCLTRTVVFMSHILLGGGGGPGGGLGGFGGDPDRVVGWFTWSRHVDVGYTTCRPAWVLCAVRDCDFPLF